MAKTLYNWKRYWVPRDGAFSYDSQGFLLPPARDAEWAKYWKTDVIGFEEMLLKPCLVLLGEPGIGKSFAIHDIEERTSASRQDAAILSRNLSDYSSDNLLVSDIFESPEFLSWKQTGYELHIFLDSFDECLMRVDAVANLLATQFTRGSSVHNLFLRIASRTVEWQASLEEALRKRWGEDEVTVLELAPLTHEQVLEAAIIELNDPEKFVAEVVAREVVPFAIKPLTLDLLFRVWKKRGGSLPPTQREIYEQGCLELCNDEKRDSPKLQQQFSSEQRLAVASHIAAATFFCNRAAIWKGASHRSPETDVSLSELSVGSVTYQGQQLKVTEPAVIESLKTGLFTSRGQNRFGWAHQTYGEFLAARYLVKEGLTDRQIFDLLTHPSDSKQKVIPQLEEIAAWAATPGSVLFSHLVSVQPDVLLRSDVATADESIKSTIVDALIDAFANGTIQKNWWNTHADHNRYKKLQHVGLGKQLRAYLLDSNLASDARIEVIAFIEVCELQKLYPDLVTIALDLNEDQNVREWAAGFIARSSDTKLKGQLKPLALGKAGNDPRDELRGAGLLACWPEHLSADELFSSIKEPDDNFTGIYQSFLSKDLFVNLSPTALPTALAWAEVQHSIDDYPHSGYASLVPQILDRAAEYIDDDSVLIPLAKTLLSQLRDCSLLRRRHPTQLTNILKSRPKSRLKLANQMIQFFEDSAREPMLMTGYSLNLLSVDDVPWLVEQTMKATSPELQKRFARIAEWVFHPTDLKIINAVVEGAASCPILSEIMSAWLEPWEINSERAKKAKEQYLIHQRYLEEDKHAEKQKTLVPSPSERILHMLDEFESGDLEVWWHPYFWVEADKNGHILDNVHQVDIRGFSAWADSPDHVQVRIVSAAEHYLRHRQAKPEDWFSKRNIIYYPAVGGFRALLLLGNERPEIFDILPQSIWEQWMPVIMRIEPWNERDAHCWLAAKSFEHAPDTATEWVVKAIDEENKERGDLPVLSKLPDSWEDSLGRALLQRAKKGRLTPRCFNDLQEALLKHGVPGALEFTRKKVCLKGLRNERGRQLALHAARQLMKYGEPTDWSRVWKLMIHDTDFGKDLLEGFYPTFSHSLAGSLTILSENDVSQLWEWMLVQYPPEEDPGRSRGGSVTTRDAMADIRNSLISYLADLGTPEGCNELQRLITKYPQYDWFRRVLLRGQEQMRRLTWQPTFPDRLFQLATNHRARLVQSGDQLLEAIIESLNVLQERLLGETPLAQFLWDGGKPKPEEPISDWIKVHLEEDLTRRGVVLGREVQIHRYDETDIHVTAITKDPAEQSYGSVKVIIEVKGAWNTGLKTAMKTQLVDRYLKDNDCRHGLYLVCWFDKNGWDNADYRKKKVPFSSRNKLESFFDQQADSLSCDGLTIEAKTIDFSMRQPATQKKTKR